MENEKYEVLEMILDYDVRDTKRIQKIDSLKEKINEYAAKGYRVHTYNTFATGSDNRTVRAIVLLEKID